MQKYIRLGEILEKLGVTRQTLWRWTRTGQFPRPIRLGRHCAAWPEEELAEWERQRIASRTV